MGKYSQKKSLSIAIGLHVLLAVLIIVSVDNTIRIPAEASPAQQKDIIDAVVVNQKALSDEVARLEAIEARKQAQEQARQHEFQRKEKESREKREQEEALALELQKKNEQLKFQQQQQEKIRVAKLKAEQEELKKIQKEKEEALALKKKVEIETQKQNEKKIQEKIAQEKAAQEQVANQQVKQNEVNRYAKLMRVKINQNWRQPLGVDIKGFNCLVSVRLLPTGEVIDVTVIKSSGSVEYDRSTELAVRKASPLPMPEDPNVAKEFHQFELLFHPEAV